MKSLIFFLLENIYVHQCKKFLEKDIKIDHLYVNFSKSGVNNNKIFANRFKLILNRHTHTKKKT